MAKNKQKQEKAPDAGQQVSTTEIDEIIAKLVDQEIEKIKLKEGEDVLDESGHKKTPGRPIDLNSPRQRRLIEMQIKRQLNLLHRGRNVDPNSERQKRLSEMEERRMANGGELKQGRPPMSEEEKEKAKKQREKRYEEATSKLADEARKQLIAKGLLIEE